LPSTVAARIDPEKRERPGRPGFSVNFSVKLIVRAANYWQPVAGWRNPGNGFRSPMNV
jgi:hypothetical protein